MATPPRVTSLQAKEAAQRIHDRHRRIDDPYREELGGEPAEVLSYLRKRGADMPNGIRIDDIFDAAVLHIYLWWQAAERERWLLDTAERLGVAHGEYGKVFGMRSRQGFRDRADRLHALLDATGSGRPDEKSRRADRTAVGRRGDEAMWLDTSRAEILSLARDVVAFYPIVDDETAEDLLEVRRDLQDGRYGTQTFVLLSEAVRALRACPVEEVAAQAGPLNDRLIRLQEQRAAVVDASASER